MALDTVTFKMWSFGTYKLLPVFAQLFKTLLEATMHNLMQCNLSSHLLLLHPVKYVKTMWCKIRSDWWEEKHHITTTGESLLHKQQCVSALS